MSVWVFVSETTISLLLSGCPTMLAFSAIYLFYVSSISISIGRHNQIPFQLVVHFYTTI